MYIKAYSISRRMQREMLLQVMGKKNRNFPFVSCDIFWQELRLCMDYYNMILFQKISVSDSENQSRRNEFWNGYSGKQDHERK